jgi:hypothetical protein
MPPANTVIAPESPEPLAGPLPAESTASDGMYLRTLRLSNFRSCYGTVVMLGTKRSDCASSA